MAIKKPKVSRRISLLVELALDGAPFWDLCCDHGHIGLTALESRRFTKVFFVDSAGHIIDRLYRFINYSHFSSYENNIQLIASKAENLDFVIDGTCVIAGVGGKQLLEFWIHFFKRIY